MRNPVVSRSATWLVNLLISTKDRGFFDNVRAAALLRARRIWVRVSDPLVEYNFCGSKLHMPLSHNLFRTLQTYPLYSDNLGRIAAHLATKYRDLTVIDIGANVGDSVAIIHRHTQVPILCVEGEARFAELLAANVTDKIPVPVIEQSFVGTCDDDLVAVVHDGTARLAHAGTHGGPAIRMKSLEQILQEHPAFQGSRLLKIDTDGMDIAILNSALDWISRQKPVLFFEYDPDLQLAHGAGGLELLGKLKRAGYHRVLVYEASGDYMFSAELGNCRLFSELHEYLSGRDRYCDLCIFHGGDEDIAEIIRRKELDVFRAARQYMAAPEQVE